MRFDVCIFANTVRQGKLIRRFSNLKIASHCPLHLFSLLIVLLVAVIEFVDRWLVMGNYYKACLCWEH